MLCYQKMSLTKITFALFILCLDSTIADSHWFKVNTSEVNVLNSKSILLEDNKFASIYTCGCESLPPYMGISSHAGCNSSLCVQMFKTNGELYGVEKVLFQVNSESLDIIPCVIKTTRGVLITWEEFVYPNRFLYAQNYNDSFYPLEAPMTIKHQVLSISHSRWNLISSNLFHISDHSIILLYQGNHHWYIGQKFISDGTRVSNPVVIKSDTESSLLNYYYPVATNLSNGNFVMVDEWTRRYQYSKNLSYYIYDSNLNQIHHGILEIYVEWAYTGLQVIGNNNSFIIYWNPRNYSICYHQFSNNGVSLGETICIHNELYFISGYNIMKVSDKFYNSFIKADFFYIQEIDFLLNKLSTPIVINGITTPTSESRSGMSYGKIISLDSTTLYAQWGVRPESYLTNHDFSNNHKEHYGIIGQRISTSGCSLSLLRNPLDGLEYRDSVVYIDSIRDKNITQIIYKDSDSNAIVNETMVNETIINPILNEISEHDSEKMALITLGTISITLLVMGLVYAVFRYRTTRIPDLEYPI